MILKIVLTILGWLKENLLGVVTLAVGLWVAWRIYRLQGRQATQDHEEIMAFIKVFKETYVGEAVKEREKRTGEPVTPETRAEFEVSAGAAATILTEYISSGTVKLSGTGPSVWVRPSPWAADVVSPTEPGKASFVNPEEEDKK